MAKHTMSFMESLVVITNLKNNLEHELITVQGSELDYLFGLGVSVLQSSEVGI